MTTENTNTNSSENRPRIALMTNHGYAGVEIPVGGAPDTGGQNFYVNSKARALEKLGMDVTIFARGGFPFFETDKTREGTEYLSPYIKYVYIQGGGNEFIRKEDIAPVLKEEALWLADYISRQAEEAGVEPWDYYECMDTHYWDAALIQVMVIERWLNQIAYSFISRCRDGALRAGLEHLKGDAIHKESLYREIEYHLGKTARRAFSDKPAAQITKTLTGMDIEPGYLECSKDTPQSYRETEQMRLLGKVLASNLEVNGKKLDELADSANRHIWTPHSTAIIKERNYWEKDLKTVRSLKFTERNNHEEHICRNTPLFCSTSPEVWRTLYSFHDQPTESIFDFPPCLDTELFKPRSRDELQDVLDYMSGKSGISSDILKRSRIVFESSRMDRTKRKDLLLRAFTGVAEQTDDTYLFIGGGPESSKVFKELTELKNSLPRLEGRAFLLGFIPEELINRIFSVPTLFVSASEMEGFGMSVSQAAAAKVAVVSSDLIPFSTQFASEPTVIVEAGDVEGFTSAMLNLLNNDREREKRAEELYNIALDLNWENTTEKYIRWYRRHFDLPE